MSKTINRIMKVIKHLGISARQFDISIGTANGYILRMEKNNASVGSDVIERIVKTYPQVNLVWLITGKGNMLIDGKNDKHNLITDQALEDSIKNKLNQKLTNEKRVLLEEILQEIKKLHSIK